MRVLKLLTVAGLPLLSVAESDDLGPGKAAAPADAEAHVGKPLPSAEEIVKLPADGGPEFNRLIFEKSPYLLQHARNPVDWYPWVPEAFEKARRENKAVFLSVGYSTCHWCHVMERESFENPEIAALMNEHFVSIKVDREERPDVDGIYMSVVQMLTGGGGWPMSVFLTPEGKPFWGGTYFPPDSKWGRPGFKQILTGIATAQREQPERIHQSAEQITAALRSNSPLDALAVQPATAPSSSPVRRDLIAGAVRSLKEDFDPDEGGFGAAPKFPPSMSLSLLLREHFKTGDAEALRMVGLTLERMASGGMYDHLGGGFHRYSTDAGWLVPHFEKMLYDNALLSRVYLEAYQATGKALYRRVAVETLDYVLQDMTDSQGGFYSAQDADSEGQEGKYYLWTRQEICTILGNEDGRIFCDYYGVRDGGNFRSLEEYHSGRNILHVPAQPQSAAQRLGLDVTDMERRLDGMRAKLLAVRARRVPPGLDDKVLTAWNGLMISSLARGYQIVRDERYRKAAERAAQFVLDHMRRGDRLLRRYRDGEAALAGYLDDYAFFISGLIDLYEATFDVQWLDRAVALNDVLIRHYWDEAEGGFFFTADDHQKLLTRPRNLEDGAIPSGNSVAVMNLLRLAKLTDNAEYRRKAERVLTGLAPLGTKWPRAFVSLLEAVDFYVEGPEEIAIAAVPGAEETEMLVRAIHSHYLPNRVLALVNPGAPGAEALGRRVPLLAGRGFVGGKPAVYVCRNFACKLPVTTAQGIAQQLGLSETPEP